MMDRTCRNSCHVTAVLGQDKSKGGAKSEPCTLCVNTPLMRSNDKVGSWVNDKSAMQ
jgi:hypothetical protein